MSPVILAEGWSYRRAIRRSTKNRCDPLRSSWGFWLQTRANAGKGLRWAFQLPPIKATLTPLSLMSSTIRRLLYAKANCKLVRLLVLWTSSLPGRSSKCSHLHLSVKMMEAAEKAPIYPLGIFLSLLITDGFGRGSAPAANLFGCVLHVEACRNTWRCPATGHGEPNFDAALSAPRCANVRQILECGGGIDTELITFEGTLHSEPLDP